ncbi:Peptidase, M23/M37 family [hydrothermal vent metagenome]|uniref:Peptidase, M23/M37 family n=1 Tax=hydrothermal vent metagenome TaxID=652676 RepID=A0A3B1B8V7_9ZZZZ
MIRDYKRSASYISNKRRHVRPLFLLAVPLALTATAVYATFQIMEVPNTPTIAANKPAVDTIKLTLPIPAKNNPASTATPTIAALQLESNLAQLATPPAPPEATIETTAPTPSLSKKEHRIRSGENLAIIFSKLGLSANLLHRIVNSNKTTAKLAHIKPGETLHATMDAKGNLHELVLEHSAIRSLKILPEGNSFKATEVERQLEPRTTHRLESNIAQLTIPSVPPEDITETTAPTPSLSKKEHRIRSGENLAIIFSKLGLSANLLHRIVNSNKTTAKLAHIKPGETLHATMDAEGNLHELTLEHSAIRSLKILPEGNSFKATKVERQLEPRTAHATGTVTSSLFTSAQQAGLSDKLIMELANMFGWDIDFALEIRAGDRFSIVYQEDFLDGDKYRDGPILAAEFINQGRVFRAIRYVDKTGHADYFSPNGKSVRKAFLRSPVDFRRISSRFQKSRWHPVLGKKRPHRGVDYAASTGTPIKASGDGKIIHRARKGGYGRAVIIEHGGGITTLYAHMSRYASKQHRGSRVKQGQTIGYVGKSGLASGPHLHYEFRINGTHRNPLTVKLPAANPIAKKYLADFKQQAAPLIARLDVLSKTLMAEAPSN